jgi:hypothetical protein
MDERVSFRIFPHFIFHQVLVDLLEAASTTARLVLVLRNSSENVIFEEETTKTRLEIGRVVMKARLEIGSQLSKAE